jgi:hypothetical protein
MAEGFFKSSAQLMNNLASSLGRRGHAEDTVHAQEPVLESHTGVREAVDPGPVLVVDYQADEDAPVAVSPSGGPQPPRTSGFQQITVQELRSPNQALRAANVDFEDRVGDRLELPLAVLVNQRDRALRELFDAHEQNEQRVNELVSDHDRFVAFLMQQHAERLAGLEQALATERAADRARSEEVVAELRSALEALLKELEDTRTDAVKLQGERDDAIRATDEVRAELQAETDAAREENIELQARLDEAERALTDARDRARDEIEGLQEQIAELRRRDEAPVD